MAYKGIILGVTLLTPIATATCLGAAAVEQKIQQLKEQRYQKELELSDLGEKIAEKQALLKALYIEACTAYNENISDLNLKDQELEKHTNETNEAGNKILTTFESKVRAKELIKGFLLHELIDNEKDIPGDFNAINFWFLRAQLEHDLLEDLIGHYEDCLKELFEIKSEIKTLSN
jgi:hypothetical protein